MYELYVWVDYLNKIYFQLNIQNAYKFDKYNIKYWLKEIFNCVAYVRKDVNVLYLFDILNPDLYNIMVNEIAKMANPRLALIY